MDNHRSVTDAAQRLARRSPDAAEVFLDLKLDSDDSSLDMAPKEPTSNTTSGDRDQPPVRPPRAMSAKQKRKAAAQKRLATMQRKKEESAAAAAIVASAAAAGGEVAAEGGAESGTHTAPKAPSPGSPPRGPPKDTSGAPEAPHPASLPPPPPVPPITAGTGGAAALPAVGGQATGAAADDGTSADGKAIGGVPLLAAPPVTPPSSVGVVKDVGGGSAARVSPLVAGAAVGATGAMGSSPHEARHTLPPLGSPPASTGGPGAPRRPSPPPPPPAPPSMAVGGVAAAQPAVGAGATSDAAGDGPAADGEAMGGVPLLAAPPVTPSSSVAVVEDGGGGTAARAPPSAAGVPVGATGVAGSKTDEAHHTPPPVASAPASTVSPVAPRLPSRSPPPPATPSTVSPGVPGALPAVGGQAMGDAAGDGTAADGNAIGGAPLLAAPPVIPSSSVAVIEDGGGVTAARVPPLAPGAAVGATGAVGSGALEARHTPPPLGALRAASYSPLAPRRTGSPPPPPTPPRTVIPGVPAALPAVGGQAIGDAAGNGTAADGKAIGGVPLLAAPPVTPSSSVAVVEDGVGGTAAWVPPLAAGAAVGATRAVGSGAPEARHTPPPLGALRASTDSPLAPRRPGSPPPSTTPLSTAGGGMVATQPGAGAKATDDAAGDGTAADGKTIGGVPLLAAPPATLPSSVGVVEDGGGGSTARVPPLVSGAAVGATLAAGNGPPEVRRTLPPLGSPPASTGGLGAPRRPSAPPPSPRRPSAPPPSPTPPSTAGAVVAATQPAVGAKATGDAAGDDTAAYGKAIGGVPPLAAPPVSLSSSLAVVEDGGGGTAALAPPSAAGAAVGATRAVGSGPKKARHTPPPLGSPPASTGGPGAPRRPSPPPPPPPPPKTKGIGAPAPHAAVGGEEFGDAGQAGAPATGPSAPIARELPHGGTGGGGGASCVPPVTPARPSGDALSSRAANKRRWGAAFVAWGLEFEDDMQDRLINMFVSVPHLYPSFFIHYAKGTTLANPPATQLGVEDWFSRVLSSTRCGKSTEDAPPLDRVHNASVHAVISAAYAKYNITLPAGSMPVPPAKTPIQTADKGSGAPPAAAGDASSRSLSNELLASRPSKKRKRAAVESTNTKQVTKASGKAAEGASASGSSSDDGASGASPPDGHDLTYMRMMIGARLMTERYDVKRRKLPTPKTIAPLLAAEQKLGVSPGTVQSLMASWRWGRRYDKRTRVYDKLVELAKKEPGVRGKEDARRFVVDFCKFAIRYKKFINKRRDRESSSVAVPWEKWLDDLLLVFPKFLALRKGEDYVVSEVDEGDNESGGAEDGGREAETGDEGSLPAGAGGST